MYCGECGTKAEEGQKFCGNCGAQLPQIIVKEEKKEENESSWIFKSLIVFGVFIIFGAGYVIFFDGSISPDSPKIPAILNPFVPTDVDNPKDYPYASQEETCKRTFVSTARSSLFEIDKQIRSGESSISLQEEEEIGKEVLSHLEKEMGGRLVQDSKDAKYIAKIGEALAMQAQRKEISYQFYLMEDTKIENALALPGGYIVVTRPLFNNWAENEAQIATVIAHEIIHIDRKHTTALYEYARKVLKTSDKNEIALFLTQMMTKIAYSTEREAESDVLGAEIIHKEGYSTFQSVKVWEKIAKRKGEPKKKEGGNILTDILEGSLGELEDMFASHPNPSFRACNLKNKTYHLYKSKYLDYPYVGTENFKLRTTKQEKEF